MKLAFIDIGELGWSLYLSAHVRWLKRNTNDLVAIITYPNRKCLYEGMADIILDVPELFYTKFDIKQQNGLGLRNAKSVTIKSFFLSYIPEGYSIPPSPSFNCDFLFWNTNKRNMFIFEPYKNINKLEGNREILIFPRYRWEVANVPEIARRNLPSSFYASLIERLCIEFPALTVRAIGTNMGAYDINVEKTNYVNWVGKSNSLQDFIDRCQVAVVAVGSQSAPPKLALIQGVPTFMIGHQRQRHISHENWMGTKAGFYDVAKSAYGQIDIKDCIENIISFIKESVEDIGCKDKIISK